MLRSPTIHDTTFYSHIILGRRVKISHDPNNTTWAQSTSGFGHKIMTSQGWTPGSYLGARNANHSDTFTAASASHIRVTLKDDTLGLGARAPTLGNDNVAAIDAFQGLLGRLNGKSDVQLEQEQRKRDDTRLAVYASQKWQAVTFISGGFLVQEKPDDALESKIKKKHGSPNDAIVADQTSSDESKDDSADDITPPIEDEASVSKTEKAGKDIEAKDMKEKKRRRKEKEDRKVKSDKKAKKNKEEKEKKDKKDKTKKKEKKRDDEEKKKEKKDSSKKRRRAEKDVESESSDSSSSYEADNKTVQQNTVSSQAPRPNWRHAIRGRHIQQKRMAIMDERSLGEVSIQLNSMERQILCMGAYIRLDFHDQSLIASAILTTCCIITQLQPFESK
jgi:Pin2-interacting protein X1